MVNLSFVIKAERLKHILSVCSLKKPKGNEYIFENVVGTFYPEGKLEIISESGHVFTSNEFTGIQVSGIKDPTRCAMRAKETLELLSLYTGDIKLTADTKNGEWVIESVSTETRKKTNYVPMIEEREIQTSASECPFPFNEEGIPLLKKGTFAMNIVGEIPSQALKDQVKEVETIGMDPRFFTIEFDDQNQVMKTFAGDRSQRAKRRGEAEDKVVSMKGSGVCCYALGFENVMGAVEGIIKVCTVNGGPIWVVQEGENFKLQYMISPAAMEA